MKLYELDLAIAEANRFLKRAKEARAKYDATYKCFFPCKEVASVKRASMDLSRALTGIRR